ncbi:MAG: SBBP repeat-containing protein [Anaerolineae bacterium]
MKRVDQPRWALAAMLGLIIACTVMLAPALVLAEPSLGAVAAATGEALAFVENAGQFAAGVRYQALLSDGTLWLAEDGLWLTQAWPGDATAGVALRLKLLGARLSRPRPFGAIGTEVSYFPQGDPATWATAVAVWSGVRYVDAYPGLDLVVTGSDGAWEWFLVPAGAEAVHSLAVTSPNVALSVEGATTLRTTDGRLAAATTLGDVSLPLLATASEVPTVVVSAGAVVSSPYGPLPQAGVVAQAATDLSYSTYIGGTGNDRAYGVAVDAAGNAYVTGYTASVDFPATPGAYDPTANGEYDVFVLKLAPSGAVVYATYIGGARFDYARDSSGIAVDVSGNAYVVGYTDSVDFPTVAALDASLGGAYDAFVLKLGPAGNTILYSTLLGGSNADYGRAVAVDAAGNAYVAGQTASADFPVTAEGFGPAFGGGTFGDGFVAKLSPAGDTLVYSGYIGGSGEDWATGLSVDPAGSVYVVGQSGSPDLPTTAGSYQPANAGGDDVFVAKVQPDGSALEFATMIGGTGTDLGRAIALDGMGSAYVTGYTASTDYPVTVDAYDRTYGSGDYDAFVTKLAPGGASLVYSTYLGGTLGDYGRGIAVDARGGACIVGNTYSQDFVVTPGAYDGSHGLGGDAFLLWLSQGGTSVSYSTFVGGSADDSAFGLALDGARNAYVVGDTYSVDYPVTAGAADAGHSGLDDAFASRLQAVAAGYIPLVRAGVR